ncbi:glycoside hydrolase family 9 protein [Flavobacterium sp. AC]|uniref:Glycoside hydrolase family 9 protein n=1 Tax=Flavobacterium azizsancarii TaxID=2961580 RepID=A0ABT4WEW4_9FLAO|nr:glycoside hydrolase family 9 protein [Flavobacterium azizsancarii]MDA6070629.1 glycoside hydrolase family 9 protein [Flavobacterium azizsancarii]
MRKLTSISTVIFNRISLKKVIIFLCLFNLANNSFSQNLLLNEKEYFETLGLNIWVFNNEYNGMFFDEKAAGIEFIHHGVRTVTGGAIRLQNTPEQWDLIPKMISRKVNRAINSIEVTLRYEDFDFDSKIIVTPQGKGFVINVMLDKPVPKQLEGRAGFNLEFLPTSYFESNYLVDGKAGTFPRYPSGNTQVWPSSQKIPQFAGHNTFDDRGKNEFIVALPLESGKNLILAPENPERTVNIYSEDQDVMLFDGRNLGQNGWFIARSILPANKKGKVLTWYVEPNVIPSWTREPIIGFSQVGYMPSQKKVAVIELDINDKALGSASVFKLGDDGKFIEKLKADVKVWGNYLRYSYAKFDFSTVKEKGLYYIQYGDQKTNTFQIEDDIYSKTWHPTMDVWFPVQMDHMEVNEAYRVWHGKPFLDDCLQAPLNHDHFDGYKQGPTTDTKYKPLERIPGMAVGGWFDAGDFDIQTFSHVSVINSFVESWEAFKVNRDETYIDQKTQFVDIHRPDGQPDLLQQIEHGVLNLVAQVENIGHPVRGIVVPNLHQYHHLGDASTETDNLPYNASLKPYESNGGSSGTLDDRWAFTNRSSFLDYRTAGALAAASRALKGYNDKLSVKCLFIAEKLMREATALEKEGKPDEGPMSKRGRGSDMIAMLQLYLSTNNEQYKMGFLDKIWKLLDENLEVNINSALLALPSMNDQYRIKLRAYVLNYKSKTDMENTANPYNVPIALRGWGGSSQVINWAISNYYIHKSYPDIMDKEYVYQGLNYIFGCHPYSNLSFVNAVGNRSKKVAYGCNRADFTTIAGGVVPGLIFLKPDYLENKDDWPFFWGENECIIDGGAWYIFLANAANDLAQKKG